MINVKECGAITGAAEMLAMKEDLSPIWPSIRAEHPVDALEPVSEEGMIVECVAEAIAAIPRIGTKRHIILAGPELVGLEAISVLGLDVEVVVTVDQSLGEAAVARLAGNIPYGMKARVITSLPDCPFGPTDAVLIAIGLRGGYRFALVPAWIATVVRRYVPVFSGERILIDPLGHTVNWRRSGPVSGNSADGWVTEMLDSLFTDSASPQKTQPFVAQAGLDLTAGLKLVEATR